MILNTPCRYLGCSVTRGEPAADIELVPTPTYARYLNPVECHFFPISEFVVNNNYVNWDAFA